MKATEGPPPSVAHIYDTSSSPSRAPPGLTSPGRPRSELIQNSSAIQSNPGTSLGQGGSQRGLKTGAGSGRGQKKGTLGRGLDFYEGDSVVDAGLRCVNWVLSVGIVVTLIGFALLLVIIPTENTVRYIT